MTLNILDLKINSLCAQLDNDRFLTSDRRERKLLELKELIENREKIKKHLTLKDPLPKSYNSAMQVANMLDKRGQFKMASKVDQCIKYAMIKNAILSFANGVWSLKLNNKIYTSKHIDKILNALQK